MTRATAGEAGGALDPRRTPIQNERVSRGKSTKKRDSAGPPGTVEVLCPCCETRLLVDAGTGVVLREDRKKGPRQSFDQALAVERTRRAQSDELFGKALQSERDQRELLDRKFEEAIKKAADEPDVKPPNPFDGD